MTFCPLNIIVGGCSVFLLANTAVWINLDSILTLRTWAACYLAGSLAMMGFWCCLYVLWVPILHLPYPMPLVGAFNAVVGVATIIAVIWFKIPRSWRKNPTFLKRAQFLLLAQFFILIMCIEYWFFSWVFYAIPLDLQWIMSIVLPISREIGAHILTKICERVASRKDASAEIIAAHLGHHHCCLIFI